MRKKYESPAMQEDYAEIISEILIGSNIGGGGDGEEPDAKECAWDIWVKE